jgi:hypothetical protein
MLIANWREVLRKAWSIRLILLAGLLSGLEAVLPYIGALPIPSGVFALLSMFVIAASFAARLMAQKDIKG